MDRLKETQKKKDEAAKMLGEELTQVEIELEMMKEYAKAEALLKNVGERSGQRQR